MTIAVASLVREQYIPVKLWLVSVGAFPAGSINNSWSVSEQIYTASRHNLSGPGIGSTGIYIPMSCWMCLENCKLLRFYIIGIFLSLGLGSIDWMCHWNVCSPPTSNQSLCGAFVRVFLHIRVDWGWTWRGRGASLVHYEKSIIHRVTGERSMYWRPSHCW